MQCNCPLITIITIVYNDQNNIEKTINSVINQTFENKEYIIIDGGSKDRTLEIIKKYNDKIDYWQSEKDFGISDAFNKGLKQAKGQWIIYLNSGDTFVNNTILEIISKTLIDSEGKDLVVYGKIRFVSKTNKYLKTYGNEFNKKKFLRGNCIPHQATFAHHTCFSHFGKFDLRFKRAMDFEFFLRDKAFNPKYVNMEISEMLIGGISQRNFQLLLNEFKYALTLHNYKLSKFFIIYQMIKHLKYKIRHTIFRIQEKL